MSSGFALTLGNVIKVETKLPAVFILLLQVCPFLRLQGHLLVVFNVDPILLIAFLRSDSSF